MARPCELPGRAFGFWCLRWKRAAEHLDLAQPSAQPGRASRDNLPTRGKRGSYNPMPRISPPCRNLTPGAAKSTDLKIAAIVVVSNLAQSGERRGGVESVRMAVESCQAAKAAEPGPMIAVVRDQADADEIGLAAGEGQWRVMVNSDSRGLVVPALRLAMRSLPLVDAFWIHCGHSGPELPQAAFPRMAAAYEAGRLRLGRIVVPMVGGKEVWPWLVDIGFRQPFVELADDGDPWTVVEANRGQVIGVEA